LATTGIIDNRRPHKASMPGRYKGNFFMVNYDANLQRKRHIHNSIG